ncbi:MAG: ABC transporter ATP-binding protein [Isosphaeraceae bacterium]
MNTSPQNTTTDPSLTPIIEFRGVSKWYGNVIGVNRLTVGVPAGVTGLLGPNGAGKSTFLQLATGQLRPSQGEVLVLGHHAWNNPALNRYLGVCPEQDAFYEWMSGRRFIETCARLGGLSRTEAREATARVLDEVGMTEHADRAVGGYSKGMRQRTKIAQALVHDPLVLFLDEPLTGTDPLARRDLIAIIQRLGASGKSVVLSSHVLHEVEAVTPRVILINHGRLVAEGNVREIRDLIDAHPHRIVLKSQDDRILAARLVAHPDVVGIVLERTEGGILVETRAPDAFYGRLAALALDDGISIDHVESADDNLDAVFRYLVNS